MPKKSAKPAAIYQIKVTLVDSKPPIWRRLLVRDNIDLSELHHVLQIAMGWEDYHLHQYCVGRNTYIGDPDQSFDADFMDEHETFLKDIVSKPKDKFLYEYDFGDSWHHIILLEKILPLNAAKTPMAIKAVKACPPEDVGGMWGYQDFLEIISDPEHPEYEETREWVGDEFDPDHVDLDAINMELARIGN